MADTTGAQQGRDGNAYIVSRFLEGLTFILQSGSTNGSARDPSSDHNWIILVNGDDLTAECRSPELAELVCSTLRVLGYLAELSDAHNLRITR